MPRLGDIPGQTLETVSTRKAKTYGSGDRIGFFESVYKNDTISNSSLVLMLSINNSHGITFDSCNFLRSDIVSAFRVGLKVSATRPREVVFKDCNISLEQQAYLYMCLTDIYCIKVKTINTDSNFKTVIFPSKEEPICKPNWFLELREETKALRERLEKKPEWFTSFREKDARSDSRRTNICKQRLGE